LVTITLQRTRSLAAGRMGTLFLALLMALILLVVAQRIFAGGFFFFLQILVFGVANGAIYGLIALGYTMVYGIIELINFAHGDLVTLGVFMGLVFFAPFGLVEGKALGVVGVMALVAVFLIAMLLTGGINVLIERVAYRPLRNSPRLAPLITAVGMSFVLEGIMYLWRGAFQVHVPDVLPASRITLGPGASIGVKDLIVIAIAVVLVIGLDVFIGRTRLGKAMRATAQDRDSAQLMGIDINRTISATFFIGAVLAAAGGIVRGLYFNTVNFSDGYQLGLFAFTAAVFGGIGNIQGAALGGLFIGLVKAFGDAYFSSAWTDVYIFAILILVLVFRPSGLLGMRVPEK
jgi:branched-chain amino acid transport system permease protein